VCIGTETEGLFHCYVVILPQGQHKSRGEKGEVGEKSDEKTWESVTWKYNSHSTTVFVTVISCVEVTLIL
jgi:hypothetical protein